MALTALFPVLLALAALAPAAAWWDVGHMLVADIAYLSLSKNEQDTLGGVVNFLSQAVGPGTNTVTEAACWQDDVRAHKLHLMEPWHFIDLVYNPEGITVDAPDPFAIGNNAVQAITMLNSTARQCDHAPREAGKCTGSKWSTNPVAVCTDEDLRPRDEDLRPRNTTLASSKCTGPGAFEVSFAARTLLHIVGDLHQPLHAASMVSRLHPRGDAGGNLCRITLPGGGAWELHAFWDSGGGALPTSGFHRPLNATAALWVREEALRIMRMHPPSAFDLLLGNATAWALESHELAVAYAYNGTCMSKGPSAISLAYQEAAQAVIVRQLALGGYRLASLFRDFAGMPTPRPLGMLGAIRQWVLGAVTESNASLSSAVAAGWLAAVFVAGVAAGAAAAAAAAGAAGALGGWGCSGGAFLDASQAARASKESAEPLLCSEGQEGAAAGGSRARGGAGASSHVGV